MTKRIPLLLCLSLTLCACPDDSDEPSESGGRGGSPPRQGASGAPGGGDVGTGPSTACVYVESSSMYCPGGPTDNRTQEAKCRDNSSCGLKSDEFVSGGCKFSTTYLSQQTFEGTCEEYERAQAAGEAPLGDGTCAIEGTTACHACAKQNCCEPLQACNDPDDCMAYFFCVEGCRPYIDSPTEVWDICMKNCYGFTRLESSEAVSGVMGCLSQSCDDAC